MTEKKEYQKPEMKKVKLVAEEAVLTNCKNPSLGGGPNVQSACHTLSGGLCLETGS